MKHHNFTNFLVVALLIIGLGPLYPARSIAGTITDNFNGAAINHRLWQPYNHDQHQRWLLQDGELKIQIDGASTGPEEFGAGVNSKFLMKGNFEVTVDYRLIKWPNANGVSIGFNNDKHFVAGEFVIRRISIPLNQSPDFKENYKAAFDDGSMPFPIFYVPTTDTNGSLKWARVGSVMTGYFFNPQINNWQIIGSNDYSATGLDEWVGFSLNARGITPWFAGKDVEIAFDNFQVKYDQIKYLSAAAAGTMLLLD
jgi:hypothetical protein